MSRNLHKAYYKDYFAGIDFSYLPQTAPAKVKRNIKQKSADLCKPGQLEVLPPIGFVSQSFRMKVLYPGLVTGVGIDHETKIEGEFKLGMHFDWTYGMPVVYGSSVKGVLRAWFKEFYEGKEIAVERLVEDIYEGGKKSIYDRDIFFDAVMVKPDKKGRILCSDSITPHGDNPLKNPVPLTFMKIAPGSTLEFRFRLVDSDVDGNRFTADEKLALFKRILATVGIGAKTNVGYGQLQAV